MSDKSSSEVPGHPREKKEEEEQPFELHVKSIESQRGLERKEGQKRKSQLTLWTKLNPRPASFSRYMKICVSGINHKMIS